MTLRTMLEGLTLATVLSATVLTACSTKKDGGNAAASKDDKKPPTSTVDLPPVIKTGRDNPCLALDSTTIGGTGSATAAATPTGATADTTGGSSTGETSATTGNSTGSIKVPEGDPGKVVTAPVGCDNTPGTTTGGTGVTNSPTGGTASLPGGNTDLTPGPGLDGCTAQGKIWIPPTGAAPAACGEPLYDDVCCSDLANYYTALGTSTAATLKASIDKTGSERVAKGGPANLVWYGCSKLGGKHTIYGAKYVYDGNGTPYVWTESASVTYSGAGGPSLTGQPAICKEITISDLGYRGK